MRRSIVVVLLFMIRAAVGQDMNGELHQAAVVAESHGRLLVRFTGPSAREQTRQCLANARNLVAWLSPALDALAGRHMEVQAPDVVTIAVLSGEALEPATARYYPAAANVGAVAVFPSFCRLSVDRQAAVIAHELGHGLQHAAGWRTPASSAAVPWPERSREVEATANGITIMREARRRDEQASLASEAAFAAQFPEDHLAAALRMAVSRAGAQ